MNDNIQQPVELEIDLKDLFFTLLSKWKIMLLVGICAALLAGGYELYRVKQPKVETQYEEMVEKLELTPLEADTVKDYANQYKLLNESIAELTDYYEHGSVMTLDPQNVVRYSMLYMVQTDLSSFENAFSNRVFSDEDYAAMRAVLGLDENAYDLQSLVNILGNMIGGPVVDSSQEGMNSVAGSILDTVLTASTEVEYSGIITLTVFAGTVEQAKELSDIADTAIRRYAENLVNAGATLNLEVIDTSYVQEWNDTINSLQEEKKDALNTKIAARTTFNKNYVSSLTTNQKELYNYLVYSNDNDTEDEISISKKIIVLGFILGVMIVFCWYTLSYILTNTVKTAEEAYHITQLPVIGNVDFVKTTEKTENAIKMTALRTVSMLEKTNTSDVFVFDLGQKDNTALLEGIKKELSTSNKQMKAGNALTNPQEYAALKGCKLAILIVDIKSTTRRELIEIMELCREIEVPLAGQISVENCK